MASNYYMKVYFEKTGQTQPEIRRFPIDISPERDIYRDLHSKVMGLLNDNRQKGFTLQYIDEDNERITFSTNDELRAAIALNKDGSTLKVFVVETQGVAQTAQSSSTTVTTTTSGNTEHHVGVRCDGCNGPVIGFRFKCMVCPDYDLCEKCSAAGIHSEHNMMKITKPGSFHPFGPHIPGPPHPHPHHFHHHARHHRHGRQRFSPLVPSPELLQKIQSQIPQWLPKREDAAHAQEHIKQHLDALKNTAQGHLQNSKEYLESVGQFLQQALSPLGIDCDFHVDEKSANNTAASSMSSSPSSTSTDVEQKEEQDQQKAPTSEEPVSAAAAATSETTEAEVTPDDMVVIEHDDMDKEATASPAIPIIEDTTADQEFRTCMEKLLAMGFPSNIPALEELVRSKNGDINAVLDALNPRQ